MCIGSQSQNEHDLKDKQWVLNQMKNPLNEDWSIFVCDYGAVGLALGFRCQSHEFESALVRIMDIKKWELCFDKVIALLLKKKKIDPFSYKRVNDLNIICFEVNECLNSNCMDFENRKEKVLANESVL